MPQAHIDDQGLHRHQAARAVGLGLDWMAIVDPVAVGAALEVSAVWTFVGYFCLGYPKTESEVPDP